MNPEIYAIIEDMKKRSPKNPIANSEIQTYLSVQSSSLLVLLAEEAEKQNQKISAFTKVLVWFTGSLIFIGLIQIYMMVIKS